MAAVSAHDVSTVAIGKLLATLSFSSSNKAAETHPPLPPLPRPRGDDPWILVSDCPRGDRTSELRRIISCQNMLLTQRRHSGKTKSNYRCVAQVVTFGA